MNNDGRTGFTVYFDPYRRTSIVTKIDNAIQSYLKKYGLEAEIVLVNPADLESIPERELSRLQKLVRLGGYRIVRPNTVYVGLDTPENTKCLARELANSVA